MLKTGYCVYAHKYSAYTACPAYKKNLFVYINSLYCAGRCLIV
jgi:hypothetical protein